MAALTGISAITSNLPNFSGVGSAILIVLGIFVLIIGGGVVGFILFNKKYQKATYKHEIDILKDVNGKPKRIMSDVAREIRVPGKRVTVFYWKRSKLYSAYPTRSSGASRYSPAGGYFNYEINRVGELKNCDYKRTTDPTEMELEFDSRDNSLANSYMDDYLVANFKDKAQSWIMKNLPVILLIILALVLVFDTWLQFSQNAKLVGQVGGLLDQAHTWYASAQHANVTVSTSGIAPAG